ncbi:MAG TPA: ACT domain-containing protein [Acidimicrobiales bacterium]|jgi:glycine cleavage system transcriptional repressor|nr:ACT domain-containing protein [Acidimicrobiales bacterium]
MPTFAITSVGQDRPGIVAAVTKVLLDSGCNLEDTAMSILGGQFAMVMVVAGPDEVQAVDLEEYLATRTADLHLFVSVREIEAASATADESGARCTVVVYGPDHPGIVHLVAQELAARNVNIVDVTTRISGTDGGLYSMVMEVVLPTGIDASDLERELTTAAANDELTVRVTPADADLF